MVLNVKNIIFEKKGGGGEYDFWGTYIPLLCGQDSQRVSFKYADL